MFIAACFAIAVGLFGFFMILVPDEGLTVFFFCYVILVLISFGLVANAAT
jgi:hypothetical protein